MRRVTRWIACLVSVTCGLVLADVAHAEPPRLGLEAAFDRQIGLSAYLRNQVITEAEVRGEPPPSDSSFQPYLADNLSRWGSGVSLRLASRGLAADLSFRWFDVSTARLHHRGQDRLSASRQRPDGTVDDSGTDYRQLDPVRTIELPPNRQATLWTLGVGADYRFDIVDQQVDVFIPVGGQLVLTHVTRSFAPFRPGLEVRSGIGARLGILESLTLVVQGRLHGLATTSYTRRSDSARRSVEIGETTEAALFSTLLYPSISAALQFRIR
jgi:hypothetical protein